jgi:hypothetical protein
MDKGTFESRILDNQGHASLLCQPDAERGCGGCCGHFDQPRHILEAVFCSRKKAYDTWVRSENDMLLYRKKMDLREKGYRQCRFLAFLDDRNETVGCLLHPARPENQGRDFRDYGFYEDCGFCAASFCASSMNLLRRDASDRQFFLLIQEGLGWYEYSRLFSCYVDLNGTKGLFNIYVRFTRPLYEAILTRCHWTDLQVKGFARQYNTLIGKIVTKIKPSSFRTGEDHLPFPHILEILSDKKQANVIATEVDRFLNAFDG